MAFFIDRELDTDEEWQKFMRAPVISVEGVSIVVPLGEIKLDKDGKITSPLYYWHDGGYLAKVGDECAEYPKQWRSWKHAQKRIEQIKEDVTSKNMLDPRFAFWCQDEANFANFGGEYVRRAKLAVPHGAGKMWGHGVRR